MRSSPLRTLWVLIYSQLLQTFALVLPPLVDAAVPRPAAQVNMLHIFASFVMFDTVPALNQRILSQGGYTLHPSRDASGAVVLPAASPLRDSAFRPSASASSGFVDSASFFRSNYNNSDNKSLYAGVLQAISLNKRNYNFCIILICIFQTLSCCLFHKCRKGRSAGFPRKGQVVWIHQGYHVYFNAD